MSRGEAEDTLDNKFRYWRGPRLLVDTAAATEVAAVGIWYARGSRDEGKGEIGSTHFIEHLLFKGTRSRNAYDIARDVDRLGGSINAFTERECMAVHLTIPSDAFEDAVQILIDLIENSQFDPGEIEKERSVIVNELESSEDEPEEYASDAFLAHIWPSHPLSRKIGGELSDLDSLSPELLYEGYKRNFSTHISVISVAGDVEGTRAYKAFSSLLEAPGGKKNGTVSRQTQRTPPVFSPSAEPFLKAPFQHTQVFCAFGGDYVELDDYYALELANAAIGDSMSSRLFQELREKSGLCYSVFSSPSLLSDASLWTAYATCSNENSGELVSRMNQEIDRLMQHGLKEDEIISSKAHIIGSMKIAASDMEYRMRRISRRVLYNGNAISHKEALEQVKQLGVQEVNQAMERFFNAKPRFFAVGPQSARASFLKAIEKGRG
ncbi:pitrilysin family protein [Treponema sp.]